MIRAMKITAIETFVVNTGFKPLRPWHFCAIRTDEGLTGYSEFGSEGLTRGLVGLVQDLGARLIGKDPTSLLLCRGEVRQTADAFRTYPLNRERQYPLETAQKLPGRDQG